MKTKQDEKNGLPRKFPGEYRLLVLVPHRDIRLIIRNYSRALFAAGYHGAWSFPWVAPLAVLGASLGPAELKELALVLRSRLLASGSGGKITEGLLTQSLFPDFSGNNDCSHEKKIAVFGPALDLEIPRLSSIAGNNKIRRWFSPLVLGAAIVSGELTGAAGGSLIEDHGALLPPPPQFSFRAAALANMIFRPLPFRMEPFQTHGPNISASTGYSYRWKIGELCWLPPIKKEQQWNNFIA